MERFGESWTVAYKDAINGDLDYKKNGVSWNNPLRFVITDINEKAVWLDLQSGSCVDAISGADALSKEVNYEIGATQSDWDDLLDNNKDPLVALMTGKLKLLKGSLFTLSRYTSSAKDLVRIASFIHKNEDENIAEVEVEPIVEKSNTVNDDHLITMQRRLDTESFPYKLYEKAKVLGVWNPTNIDFNKDKKDWIACTEDEKELILHLVSLFQSGEESVTNEIVPLMLAVSGENRLEEELFLTTFLFEEAKHTDFFNRFLSEVVETFASDLDRFKGENYIALFDRELNTVMRRLLDDPSPKNQLLASVTYNMIVEGSLAETGYHAFYNMLEKNGIMPGTLEGIGNLKQDESRHIAYGIFLISRILIEHPDLIADFEKRMSECLELVIGVIHEIFDRYEHMPFGLEVEDFINFATDQFQHRYDRIHKALERKSAFS